MKTFKKINKRNRAFINIIKSEFFSLFLFGSELFEFLVIILKITTFRS